VSKGIKGWRWPGWVGEGVEEEEEKMEKVRAVRADMQQVRFAKRPGGGWAQLS